MSSGRQGQQTGFSLYLGPEHDCSYLPQRRARSLFFDPSVPLDPRTAQWLANQGFRRSGPYLYRPHCKDCQACVALRIPVADFAPRRSQRRCWQHNERELTVRAALPGYSEEQFALYCRYQQSRHPGGSMDGVTAETYLGFLDSPWADTRFFEFRLRGRLVAVAVTDLLPAGLSAMYTFFDPTLAQRSLGVFSVLWQINYTRSRGLPWLYLGYWIGDCRKMRYKDRYRPVEAWTGTEWRRFSPGEPIQFGSLEGPGAAV